MAGFWEQHWYVVLFYVGVIALLFIFRKKFEFQGGIVALLKTGWGVKWMNHFGAKHASIIQKVAHIGIYVGYAGMLLIIGFIAYGLWQLIVNPAGPPVLTPLLPGVQVPGSPIAFPLFETLIALFIVIVVHEGAHGIVAAAHKIKVKSSGLLALGPIFGAFVEPDEKVIQKKPGNVQNAVYAAGPWSNVLQAILFFGLFLGLSMAAMSLLGAGGITFTAVVDGSPADLAGLPTGVAFVQTNLGTLETGRDLANQLQTLSPGDEYIFISAQGDEYSLTLAEHAQNPEQPWVGIEGIQNYYEAPRASWTAPILIFILDIIYWTFIIALGLGLANLIPLGPVDGGRMYLVALQTFMKNDRAEYVWKKTALLFLIAVVLLIFVPILQNLSTRFFGL